MTFVLADWKITRSTKEIEYIGDLHGGTTPSYATGIELHRGLMDLADAGSDVGDDQMSITDDVPSARGGVDTNITLTNGYKLTSATGEGPQEHIYDTSITEAAGATIYDGLQNFGNAVSIQIIQDGARIANDFWNEAKMITAVEDTASSTTHRFLILVRSGGADIDGRRLLGTQRVYGTINTEFFIGGGTNRGNNTLALNANDDINNNTIAATVETWDTIVNDVEGWTQIDADADTVNENYYSDWELGAFTKNDFYERAKWIQTEEAGARDPDQVIYGLDGDIFRGITHDITYDTASGTLTELNDLVWGTEVLWDAPLATAGTVGEYYTFSLSGAVGRLLALDDNTTVGYAIFAIEPGSGTVENNDVVTRVDGTAADGFTVDTTITDPAAVGGVGRLLADDGTSQVYIQLLSGVIPADGLTLWDATTAGVYDNATGAKVDVNATVTPRLLSSPFVGASTGTAIVGAYGLGIGADDLAVADSVTALDATPRNPPNNVTFNVTGLDITAGEEDYVMIGPEAGGVLDEAQDVTITPALTGAAVTIIEMATTIPVDTPASGNLRVQNDEGRRVLIPYTSYTGSQYTIPAYDFSGSGDNDSVAIGNEVYIVYLDKQAVSATEGFTTVFDSPRNLILRVRNGYDLTPAVNPIVPWETLVVLTAAGGSQAASRVLDS